MQIVWTCWVCWDIKRRWSYEAFIEVPLEAWKHIGSESGEILHDALGTELENYLTLIACGIPRRKRVENALKALILASLLRQWEHVLLICSLSFESWLACQPPSKKCFAMPEQWCPVSKVRIRAIALRMDDNRPRGTKATTTQSWRHKNKKSPRQKQKNNTREWNIMWYQIKTNIG